MKKSTRKLRETVSSLLLAEQYKVLLVKTWVLRDIPVLMRVNQEFSSLIYTRTICSKLDNFPFVMKKSGQLNQPAQLYTAGSGRGGFNVIFRTTTHPWVSRDTQNRHFTAAHVLPIWSFLKLNGGWERLGSLSRCTDSPIFWQQYKRTAINPKDLSFSR